MDWEKVGKLAYYLLLYVIEWGFKICAVVAGWFALAASGNLGMRIGSGFSSLSFGLRRLIEIPAGFQKMSYMISDYNRMGQEIFQQTYGTGALDRFMAFLDEGVTALHRISENLSQHSFATVAATLIVFSTFYLLARIIRFARQKGRGSWAQRWERRIGNSVFSSSKERVAQKVSEISQKNSDKFQQNGFSLKQLLSS